MRKLLLIFCILGMGSITLAQTNTFPSSGNVGIGTTNPIVPLHVKMGNLTSAVARFENDSTDLPLFLQTYNNAYTQIQGNLYYNGSSYVRQNLGSGMVIRLLNGSGGLTIASAPSGNAGTSATLTDLVTVTNGGNVGIGTKNPTTALHVKMGSLTSAVARFENGPTDLPLFLQTYNNAYTQIQGNLYHNGSSYVRQNFGSGMVIRLLNGSGGLTIASAPSGNAGTSATLTDLMTVTNTGNVGIGTNDPQGYKLAVNGNMIAESVKVKLHANWPDYVFHKNYSLKPLSEVEEYIKSNEHLSDIPSAEEVKKEGLDIGEMNAKLLKKIEELTLYLIEKDKQVTDLQQRIKVLEWK